jgi:hypothetical protein
MSESAGSSAEDLKKTEKAQAKRQVHSFLVNASKFVVDSNFSPLKQLGRGAYGVVW